MAAGLGAHAPPSCEAPTRTKTDPIIAEIRAVRDEHAAQFDYDIDAIFRDIRATQETSGRGYVQFPARRVSSGLEATADP